MVHLHDKLAKKSGSEFVLPDETGAEGVEEEVYVFLLIEAEQPSHYEFSVGVELCEQGIHWLEGVFDSFGEEMGEILIVVEEQVDGLLRRDLEVP